MVIQVVKSKVLDIVTGVWRTPTVNFVIYAKKEVLAMQPPKMVVKSAFATNMKIYPREFVTKIPVLVTVPTILKETIVKLVAKVFLVMREMEAFVTINVTQSQLSKMNKVDI